MLILNSFEIAGALIGLVYLFLEYRASVWLWLVGIIMPAIYTYVFFDAGLYADFGMQIYYILAAIYGFIAWRWHTHRMAHPNGGRRGARGLPITHMPSGWRMTHGAWAVFLLCWAAIYVVLTQWTDSTVPLADSFANALSVVALWMLARKWVEQWLVWIVADLVLAALYAYKGLPFTSALYALYAVIAVFGYRKWMKIMMEGHKETITPLDEHTPFDAVILAHGDAPATPLAKGIMRRAATLVCCDGAAATALDLGLTPTAIVGDGDSLPPHIRKHHPHLFHQVDEQEDNDLTKATKYVRKNIKRTDGKPLRIAYLGLTGKREDHTLGNLSLMAHYYRHGGVRPTVVTNHGHGILTHGTATLTTHPGQQVSVFNVSCRTLRSKGLRWSLRPFRHLWQGTLNEAVGENVTFKGDGVYAVFLNNETK